MNFEDDLEDFDDAEKESDSWEGRDKFKDEMQSEMIFANLGYGITDKLEVFLRLGMSDLGFDDEGMDDFFGSVDSLAYGFGVKATLYEEGKLKLGSLFQMSWFSFDGDYVDEEGFYSDVKDEWVDVITPGDWEIDYYQVKLAVGPIYELTEAISIYGGPFFQLVDGNLDDKRSGAKTIEDDREEIDGSIRVEEREKEKFEYYEKDSYDIKQQSRYGLYFGAQINVGEHLPVCIEYQTNFDTDVFGASLAYRF